MVSDDLNAAVRDSNIKVSGDADIRNDGERGFVYSLLRALEQRDNEPGRLYIEARLARESREGPSDAVLIHLHFGIGVFELKDHPISRIEGICAGEFHVRYKGRQEPQSPFKQVERKMFEIKDHLRTLTRDEIGDEDDLPHIWRAVVLTNISTVEWKSSGYDKSIAPEQLVFQDEIENPGTLYAKLEAIRGKKRDVSTLLTSHQYRRAERIFGDSAVIREGHRRVDRRIRDGTIGNQIESIARSDKRLSEEQQRLSREEFSGKQYLVRGVAGSGKTVVLANNCANLIHRQIRPLGYLFEELERKALQKIAVVCYNRCLVPFIEEKIELAYKDAALSELNEGRPLVCNLNNLMWYLRNHGITYIRTSECNEVDRAKRYRLQIQELSKNTPELYDQILFDILYVDEAQDLHPEEFSLLLDLVRPNAETGEKSIIIFYDDAQNLYARPKPTWSHLGIDLKPGRAGSYVMGECFRNTKQIAELAFNVLLGTQAPPDIRIQTRGFADVNTLRERELIDEKDGRWHVNFTEREGPPCEIQSFTARVQEYKWIAGEVRKLILDEDVRPEDILIMGLTRELVNQFRSTVTNELPDLAIHEPHLDEHKDEYISQKGSITTSTINSAKGYDAYIVFLLAVDALSYDTKGRASFYVGATRSKYWLWLTGVDREGSLLGEARQFQDSL